MFRSFDFLNVVPTDTAALFPSTNEVFHGFWIFLASNYMVTNPLHFMLKIVTLLKTVTLELLFQATEEKEITWAEVRWIWRVLDDIDAKMWENVLGLPWNMWRCIIVEQKKFFELCSLRFVPKVCLQLVQRLAVALGIDGGLLLEKVQHETSSLVGQKRQSTWFSSSKRSSWPWSGGCFLSSPTLWIAVSFLAQNEKSHRKSPSWTETSQCHRSHEPGEGSFGRLPFDVASVLRSIFEELILQRACWGPFALSWHWRLCSEVLENEIPTRAQSLEDLHPTHSGSSVSAKQWTNGAADLLLDHCLLLLFHREILYTTTGLTVKTLRCQGRKSPRDVGEWKCRYGCFTIRNRRYDSSLRLSGQHT